MYIMAMTWTFSVYTNVHNIPAFVWLTCDGVPVHPRLDRPHLHTVNRDLNTVIMSDGDSSEKTIYCSTCNLTILLIFRDLEDKSYEVSVFCDQLRG